MKKLIKNVSTVHFAIVNTTRKRDIQFHFVKNNI